MSALGNQPEWPALPEEPQDKKSDMAAALYEAQVGAAVAGWRDSVDRQTALKASAFTSVSQAISAEDELRKEIQAGYIATASSSLDRLVKRAELLATAAAAVGSFYAALCGLAYASTDGKPLPASAIGPAAFIAFSIVLSCAYLGLVRRRSESRRPLVAGLSADLQEQRLVTFLRWVDSTALSRAWALRLSVVSLGLGSALLPLPFIAGVDMVVVPGAVVLLLLWCIGELLSNFRHSDGGT